MDEKTKKDREMWQKFYDQAKKHVDETIPEQIKELNEEFILNQAIVEKAQDKLNEIDQNDKKD